MKNSIYVNNLEVHAFHGLFPEENNLGQKFIFDAECSLDYKKAMVSDDLNDSVSYAGIADIIVTVATNDNYNLLEKLACEIMKKIFINYSQITNIKLKINKPAAPICHSFKECGVLIEASREEILDLL